MSFTCKSKDNHPPGKCSPCKVENGRNRQKKSHWKKIMFQGDHKDNVLNFDTI